MPSTQALKSRIRSVKSTKQITKAMQMVAASKMRRAQEATKASAPYTKAASEILAYLASQGLTRHHPLFIERPVKKRLIILIASDKGLAGAYNSNVMRLYMKTLAADKQSQTENEVITVGRRATTFVNRVKHTNLLSAYEYLPDRPAGHELYSILDTVTKRFTDGEVDAVDVVYTEFISSMKQQVVSKRILPAGFEKTDISENIRIAEYEPDLETVLDGAASRLIGAQVFQALLDARASEHSMRMLAMKNATDNASDLVDDLTLAMNQARQGAITQELAEISGGVEALKD